MDIAELRKKARDEQAPGEMPDQEQPSTVERETTAAAVVEELTDDGLERLFAVNDVTALTTVESDLAVVDDAAADQVLPESQYLAFHLGSEEYALNISAIIEIIKVKEFTDVPRAPEFVLGVISLRGVIVPVFDLNARLNLGVSELTTSSRIVVCQSGELTVGLLVDSIHQVVKLADDGIEPPPAVLSGLDRDFMIGVGRYHGRMVVLLDVENVLNVALI